MGVRRNAATLSTTERDNFINALLELKRTGVYDQFVAIHEAVTRLQPLVAGAASGDNAHRGPAFLPWHREYLIQFEKALNATNPNAEITIPYWKWDSGVSTDTTNIFVDDFMGPTGTSQQISVGPIMTGHFSLNNGWQIHSLLQRVIGSNALRRRTELDPVSRSLPQFTQMNADNYTDFRIGPTRTEGLENPHNMVHVWVGLPAEQNPPDSDLGSMVVMTSPNDPIFFLHHANVDRLWAKWQETHRGEAFYNPRGFVRRGHRLNDKMWPWNNGESTTQVTDLVPLLSPLLSTITSTDDRTPKDVLDIINDSTHSDHYSYDDSIITPPPSTPPPSTPPPSTPPPSTPPPSTPPPSNSRCFIATAAYGSELAPPVQFLREFRDDVVLKSRFQKPFEDTLNVYYKFSPPIAELMKCNKPFKYTMKYSVVWPFVALARATAFAAKPFVKQNKQSEE